MTEISYSANAKINLYLDITGRRDDGYHTLETVMQSVDLADIITIRLYGYGEKISVTCSNPLIPVNEDNICYKAAERYFAAIGRRYNAEIHIDKRIPHGAGLGGGSADAAAVLKALNTLCDNALAQEQLLEIGVKIGADVPFCIVGGTKLCRGIGEEMSDIEPLPERVYLVVMPDFSCSTKEAYLKYDKGESAVPIRNGLDEMLSAGEDFPQHLYNVFSVLYSDERITNICRKLRECGATGAELSGSGAAVFGVFDDCDTAAKAAACFPNYFTAVCRPTRGGVLPLP